MGSFVQSLSKCLKFTGDIWVMTMKNDTKIEEELTWEMWRIMTQALENLKNLHFNGLALTKL